MFKSHLERKFICEPTLCDVDVKTLLKNLEKQFNCRYCKKDFSHNSSKCRHEKTCTYIVNNSQQSPVASNIINNNITNNNTINNNININISLNAYDCNNIDFLLNSTEKLSTILNSKNGIIQNLLKELNFNKEHPENHNMCITNLRSNKAEVFDGSSFIVKDKVDVIHTKLIELIDIVNKSSEQELDSCVDPDRLEKMSIQFEELRKYIELKKELKINADRKEKDESFGSRQERCPNYVKVYKATEEICYNNRDLVKKKKKELKKKVKEYDDSEFF
jgi:hypothetical protein